MKVFVLTCKWCLFACVLLCGSSSVVAMLSGSVPAFPVMQISLFSCVAWCVVLDWSICQDLSPELP